MPEATDRAHIQNVRGRDAELAILGQQLDLLLSGIGSITILEAGAGMGKSRLLAELAKMAERLEIRVGIGIADPSNSVVPFSVVMEALFGGPSPILDRATLGDAHASLEERFWLLQDLEAMSEAAALQHPFLVCLDDVQWADSGTAAVLRALRTHQDTAGIAWVIALRPGQGSTQIRSAIDFLKSHDVTKIELGPLNQDGVALVTADVLGATPNSELLEMAGRAAGSPFLLVELLSGLREEGLVRIGSRIAELVEWQLPHRVSESMRLRLEHLPDLARRAATVAAALGRRFSLDDLAAMLNLSPADLLAPVEDLINADLIAESDGRLMFGHDLILEAVRASVPGSVRRTLDRQAASVLLARGALPIEVAARLEESATPGDEVAITTLFKAAEAIASTDPGTAAKLSQRALELAPIRHDLRGPLVSQTAIWLHSAGRGEEARAFADIALHQAFPAEQEAEVRLSIAGMFAVSPDVRAEEGRRALALPNLSTNLRTRHLALLFHNLMTSGRINECREVLEEATLAVESCDDVPARFALELAQSGLMYVDGGFSSALPMVEMALHSGILTNDDTRGHLAYQWHCDVLAMLDCLDEALELTIEGIASAQRGRHGWALGIFETGRGRLLLQLGHILDAAVALQGQLTVDVAPQIVSVLDAAGVTALSRAAIHLGDPTLLRSAREIANVMLDQSAPSVRRHAVWLLASQEMAIGDFAGAHKWLQVFGEKNRTCIIPLFPMDVGDEARLIHIALAVQDFELASHAADAAESRARLNPGVQSIAAAALHARGLLERDLNKLEAAAALYEHGPRPLAFAAAAEDLGLAAIGAGETDRAIEVIGRSLEVFADAGATWDARRVRGRLRSLGVRRRLVAVQRPATGWAALTDSELAVTKLVVQGLTNREVAERLFVSQHTVSGHLQHVFMKLDVNSRVELTRLASLRDL
jgi:DNA-binding CsgD family transcriptional regulator